MIRHLASISLVAVVLVVAGLVDGAEAEVNGTDNWLSDDVEEGGPRYESPSLIEISGRVFNTTPRHRPDLDGDDADPQRIEDVLMVLVDTWWKILIWALAAFCFLCMCCYVSKCCYLCWDCCTDPFWGCCPRCRGCEDFLLLRCCNRHKRKRVVTHSSLRDYQRHQRHPEHRYFEVRVKKHQTESPTTENGEPLIPSNDDEIQVGHDDRSDVALNTSTSFVSEANAASDKAGKWRRTRPNKNKERTKVTSYDVQVTDDEDYNLAESLPQLHTTRYFNVLSLLKGGTRRQYDISHDYSPVDHCHDISNDASNESNEMSSLSFSHDKSSKITLQKNDIVIEHGHCGRYQLLPEAQSELISVRVRNPSGSMMAMDESCRRISRSMDSFGARNIVAATGKNAANCSHVDMAVATDPTSFTANKYSQTDLHLTEGKCSIEPNGKVVNGKAGVTTGDGSGSNMMEKEILFGKETKIMI